MVSKQGIYSKPKDIEFKATEERELEGARSIYKKPFMLVPVRSSPHAEILPSGLP